MPEERDFKKARRPETLRWIRQELAELEIVHRHSAEAKLEALDILGCAVILCINEGVGYRQVQAWLNKQRKRQRPSLFTFQSLITLLKGVDESYFPDDYLDPTNCKVQE